MFYVLAFGVGVYVGKKHYDQLITLLKAGWAKIVAFFKKDTPTAK